MTAASGLILVVLAASCEVPMHQLEPTALEPTVQVLVAFPDGDTLQLSLPTGNDLPACSEPDRLVYAIPAGNREIAARLTLLLRSAMQAATRAELAPVGIF